MRRIALSIVLASIAMLVPLGAQAASGCTVTAPAGDSASCTYLSTGPGSFVSATPNVWFIRVIRGGEVVAVIQAGVFKPGAHDGSDVVTGSVPSQDGDTVELSVNETCLVTENVSPCVLAGALHAEDDAA